MLFLIRTLYNVKVDHIQANYVTIGNHRYAFKLFSLLSTTKNIFLLCCMCHIIFNSKYLIVYIRTLKSSEKE